MSIDPGYSQIEQKGLEIMRDVFAPILNRPVDLEIVSLEEASEVKVTTHFQETPVIVETPLEGALDDIQYFIFSQKTAAGVTDLMVMGDGTAPFSEHESLDGIAEAANQLMGALATSWGEELKADIRAGGAQGRLENISEVEIKYADYVLVTYKLVIEEWGEDTFLKLVPRSVFELLTELSNSDEEAGISGEPDPFSQQPKKKSAPQGQQEGKPAGKPNVKRAQFADFDTEDLLNGGGEMPQNLDLLLDISLPVTIELGRTQMLIRDVLEIGPGSVVELQKLSGEPVDLYINDKRFALGEVVVIDENFGIRITELLSVEDRIKALK